MLVLYSTAKRVEICCNADSDFKSCVEVWVQRNVKVPNSDGSKRLQYHFHSILTDDDRGNGKD
jgi:hypothetical protein